VRSPPEQVFRDDPELLQKVLVPTTTGAQVPLGQVAEVKTVTGAPEHP